MRRLWNTARISRLTSVIGKNGQILRCCAARRKERAARGQCHGELFLTFVAFVARARSGHCLSLMTEPQGSAQNSCSRRFGLVFARQPAAPVECLENRVVNQSASPHAEVGPEGLDGAADTRASVPLTAYRD